MAHPLITLKAKSSSGDADFHTVVFHWKDGRLDVRCDCRASAFSLLCKHKRGFLCQDVSMLFDPGQAPKLRDVAEWVKKASYGDAIEQIRALESGVEEAKDRLDKRRQELEKELEKEVEEAKSKLHDEKMRFAYSLVGKTYEPSPPKQRKPRRELFPEPQDAVDDDDDGEDGFFSIVMGEDQEPEPDPEDGSADSLALRGERSPVLIASFVDGYALGWRFAVPEAFREPLDIKLTTRSVKKRLEENWTQGRLFNIIPGSILYDTRLAYELPWDEALGKIKLAVQVVESEPSKMVLGQLKSKKLKEPVSIVKVKPGALAFDLFLPKKDPKKVVVLERVSTNQEEFVGFLRTGSIRLKDSLTRDLFLEFAK